MEALTAEPPGALEHPSLTERIYELLKKGIIRHELKGGARLLEQEIAGNLGVSRTPVREAITRLASEGLVDVVPRRGVFVAAPSAEEIADLYEVREALETLAVRRATERANDDAIADLKEKLDNFEAALEDEDYMTCFELDRQFHDKLVGLSGNGKLEEIYRLIGGNVQVTRWIHCKERARQETSLCEHRAILDALAKKDADLACGAVRYHLGAVKRDLLDGRDENG